MSSRFSEPEKHPRAGTSLRTLLSALSIPSSFVLLAGFLELATETRAETLIGWRQVMPPSAASTAMAYDSVRGKTVLFGGWSSTCSAMGSTWEWDGQHWKEVSTTGPAARSDARMAYDSKRGKCVMYGGYAEGYCSDTWEWDGSTWTQVYAPGPHDRLRHAMAYDAARGKTILFGGTSINLGLCGDTWEWDGSTWTKVTSSGPSPRENAAMAYDSARQKIVLYGGDYVNDWGSKVPFGDTWEWDGTTWKQVATFGPGSRTESSLAYDSQRGRTVLFGGSSSGETWEWDGSVWTQVAASGPSARICAAMAYDSARGKTVLFGGTLSQYDAFYGDTWEWNGAQWQQAVELPSARGRAAMAFDSTRGRAVLFGGEGSGPETWEWDGSNWHEVATTGPGSRWGCGMTFDSARGKTVLFGGFGYTSGWGADTWEWDGSAWQQVVIPGPSPREGPAMAYDSSRGKTVLFGGCTVVNDKDVFFDDSWEWDGYAWTQVTAVGPEPSAYASMAYDSARGKIVLFGGYSGQFPSYNDQGVTWEWDGSAWNKVETTGPEPRYSTVMAYDSARAMTVLYGGGGFLRSDTWEWDGSVWKELGITGPGRRYKAAMAYDSVRKQCVFYGGHNGYYTCDDTWVLGPLSVAPPPFTLDEAVRTLQCAAGLTTLSAAHHARCDVETVGASAGCIDALDACRIARKVTGLEANP